MQAIVSSFSGNEYIFIEIILLFLFASIGYKVAYLGVSIIRGPYILKEERYIAPKTSAYDK